MWRRVSAFAWIKGGAPGQAILSRLWSVNWLMTDPTRGCLVTELREASHTAQPLVSEVTITDGNWHRVAFTWDGSHRRLYVDEVLVAEDTDVPLADCNGGMNIACGKLMTPATFFTGLIDDVRIYNRAMKP